jgi:hypothetical protein
MSEPQGETDLPTLVQPIGYMKVKPREVGWRVVGPCCAVDTDKSRPVLRVNIVPYSQHCCDCGKELVPGGSIRDLFDGT